MIFLAYPMNLRRLLRQMVNTVRSEQKQSAWEAATRSGQLLEIATPQGKYWISPADTVIGQSLYFIGNFELAFMKNTMSLLRDIHQCPPKGQGIVLDVGGNIGTTSIGMLHTGEFAQAVAIEPEPQNFELLQRNVILNNFTDKIICINSAVAEHPGEVEFELSPNNFGDHRVKVTSEYPAQLGLAELYQESQRRVTRVQAAPLDDLVGSLPQAWSENLSLLWMDIQGYEGYALKGAQKLLTRGLPAVLEVWPYGLLRAGMTPEEFCDIAAQSWSHYWVWRRSKFVKYPIEHLPQLMAELGCDIDHDNVVFTP